MAWQTKSYQSSQLTLPCICLQDPSILHFLLASGDEISSKQLRDDLMTMLIAGHETTAAVLTWTLHCCSTRPDVVQRMQQEVRASVPAWSCAELRGVRWWCISVVLVLQSSQSTDRVQGAFDLLLQRS